MMNDPALDDLLNDEAINNPSSYYSKLRNISPVYWNPRWNGWIVTGYAEVTQGYRDWQRLSSDRFSGPFGGEVRAGVDEQSQLFSFLGKFFVWKDPPYHTRLRTLVGAAFSPKRLEALRPRIRELIRELAEPLRGKEKVDFFSEFSFQLSVIVIAEYLGVPAARSIRPGYPLLPRGAAGTNGGSRGFLLLGGAIRADRSSRPRIKI